MDPEGQRLLQRLPDWVQHDQQTAVLVTVWGVKGSVPRAVGARMLCRGGRLLAGTIGGGHLEEQALRDAQQVEGARQESHDVEVAHTTMEDAQDSADSQGNVARLCRYQLGPQLAQCCGGVVQLHFCRIDAQLARDLAAQVRHAEELHTPLETQFADEILRELPQPLPTVLICGAGHVAAALARVLQPLPWRVIVADARPEWAEPMRFPLTTELVQTEPLRLFAAWGWLGAEAQQSQAAAKAKQPGRNLPLPPLPTATYALVMTHDHALDRDLVEVLLQFPVRTADIANKFRYVGMIGSRSKVAALQQRLRQRGVSDEICHSLVAPIGLRVDGQLLGGKMPGEIAISVAAQLISLQNSSWVA